MAKHETVVEKYVVDMAELTLDHAGKTIALAEMEVDLERLQGTAAGAEAAAKQAKAAIQKAQVNLGKRTGLVTECTHTVKKARQDLAAAVVIEDKLRKSLAAKEMHTIELQDDLTDREGDVAARETEV